jgi:hypothetical protein
LNKLSTTDKVIEEVMTDLMDEKVMSIRAQDSSTRGVQASLSTARRSGPSQPVVKKRTKHRDDLANTNLIPTILPNYILPLANMVSRDSVPRDFDYTMVTAYLPKGIRAVRTQKDKIMMLNFRNFNLGDIQNYNMLTPYRYLIRTKGKNSKIIPQPWTMNLTQSTLLNVMKIPHFGRLQEVKACVNILLSCYHGDYLWLDRCIIVDSTLIHRITRLRMQGPDAQDFYPGKAKDHALAQKIKDTYGDVEKRTRGYKVASIQIGAVHLAYQLITRKLVTKNRPTQVTGFIVDIVGTCV